MNMYDYESEQIKFCYATQNDINNFQCVHKFRLVLVSVYCRSWRRVTPFHSTSLFLCLFLSLPTTKTFSRSNVRQRDKDAEEEHKE